MTDSEAPRAPGPWDPQSDAVETPRPAEATRQRLRPLPDQGQSPPWALASTLMTAAFIWWISGSVIVAGALVWAIFVHEFGHVLAMNRLGQGPARITIIPFFGGAAHPARGPASEWRDVLVSLAGPTFGLLATIPLFAGFSLTSDAEWLRAAFFVAMLNLINLAPAPPLDGSRALGPVLGRMHPMLEKIALIGVTVLAVIWGVLNGFFIMAAFLGLALFGQMKRGPSRPVARRLSGGEAAGALALFLGAGLLCLTVAVSAGFMRTGTLEGALAISGYYLGIGR